MAPTEFHRYTEPRGGTIIYKFDIDVLRNPSHYPANESPISVYHHWRVNYKHKSLLHSDLVPEDLAIQYWHRDQEPKPNTLMHREEASQGDGIYIRTSYVWKGWQWNNHGMKGYTKLSGARSSNYCKDWRVDKYYSGRLHAWTLSRHHGRGWIPRI